MRMKTIPPLLILLALVVVMALPARAADDAPATFEKITVGAAAVGIGTSTLQPTSQPDRRYCLIVLETADIRWRVDGTDPSSTTGTPMKADGTITIAGIRNLVRFRAIRSGGSSGVLSVTCW
jgi:hypothetical protein